MLLITIIANILQSQISKYFCCGSLMLIFDVGFGDVSPYVCDVTHNTGVTLRCASKQRF